MEKNNQIAEVKSQVRQQLFRADFTGAITLLEPQERMVMMLLCQYRAAYTVVGIKDLIVERFAEVYKLQGHSTSNFKIEKYQEAKTKGEDKLANALLALTPDKDLAHFDLKPLALSTKTSIW